MNIHVDRMIKFWSRLLVDVCDKSRVPIGAPDNITCEWLLVKAPLLEKEILGYLEGNRLEQPEIPEWLTPLWDAFISERDARLLRYLRQLLLFCYKVEHEPTDEQLKSAQAVFEDTDACVGVWDEHFRTSVLCQSRASIQATARQYVGAVIYRINWAEITPSHGPGGIYPSRKPSDKSCFRTLYQQIIAKYPYDQFFCGLPSFWWEVMVEEAYGQLVESSEIQAKLVAVPKDSRGPRLICVHPSESIWIQQGQRLLLEDAISRSPLTKGRINFTNQQVNGELALISSATGYMCTLDLKEASDRMSCALVQYLFGDYAYEWISCSRASTIKLLDGRVINLRKWAPMGNALCFPVQSLVFYSLVRAGILHTHGVDCADVYVFGDDILFPSKYYEGAIRGLVSSGFVPNESKTFRKGLFRESCGVDAYRGFDVTPLRLRSTDIASAQGAVSLLSLAKRLRLKGYEHCASAIYSELRRCWPLTLCNDPQSQGFVEYVDRDLGWLMLHEPHLRFRKGLQKWAVPCRLVSGSRETPTMGDWYLLQDSLLRISRLRSEISDRCTEYAFPYRNRLSYGWSDCLN